MGSSNGLEPQQGDALILEDLRTSPVLGFFTAGLLALVPSAAGAVQAPDAVTAIVGATVIDGNGGPPLPDATIVIQGKRIAEIGPQASVRVPPNARVLDGTGKYVTPGLIDTNVHMSPISGELNYARYWDRLEDLVLQGVQLQLKYGVTTVRDSYGPLLPMIEVRDAIARGEVVGPRMYVAGNIVGWGGSYSLTMGGIRESELNFFQEQINDFFTLGSGEELTLMTPDELRVAINAYLDKGPDFIKYGGSTEVGPPYLILFSPRAQQVIVEETHKRGLVAETHAKGLEALRLSILAGIDLIQHPEAVGRRELTDEIVDLIIERDIICSLLLNKYTGRIWKRHLEERGKTRKEREEASRLRSRQLPKTSAEVRREVRETGLPNPGTVLQGDLEMRQRNGRKLIRAGCVISVGADNLLFGRPGDSPEFLREDHPVPEHLEPGTGTIIAIEGLVELGMTPSEAIVAATKNGAMACKALDEFGTLEVGKLADILVLAADSLADISNIRKLETVIKEGQIIDPKSLATKRAYPEW